MVFHSNEAKLTDYQLIFSCQNTAQTPLYNYPFINSLTLSYKMTNIYNAIHKHYQWKICEKPLDLSFFSGV